MGESINKIITANDRIHTVALIDRETTNEVNIVIGSHLVHADGTVADAGQIQVPITGADDTGAKDAFRAAFATALGLPSVTPAQIVDAIKQAAYAARSVVRDIEQAQRLAKLAQQRARIDAALAAG